MIERALLEQALPAYEIGDELGRGGFGVVIAGRHRRLVRPVAIKQLPRAFGADPEVSRRFLAEAQVLARLEHPHIVPVFDYVEHEGLCVLVMEHMGGGTLWSRLQAGQVGPELACATTLAVLAALDRAHDDGVLHRDIKPDNVLFGGSGTVKVADFGIAKVLGDRATRGATRTGEILGTPTYMAPEQARGAELTPAVDVYAVSVMLYELLAGRPPFESDGDPLGVLYQHLHDPPPPLPDHVPAAVAAVVAEGLEKNPADRHHSAEDMAVALARAATGSLGPTWTDVAGVELVAPVRVLRSLVGPTVEPSAAGPVVVAPIPPVPSTRQPAVDGAPASPPPSSSPSPSVASSAAVPAAAVRPASIPSPAPDEQLEAEVGAVLARLGGLAPAPTPEGGDGPYVVLGRAGLPLPAAWRRLTGDEGPVAGAGSIVRLEGGSTCVWAAPLPVAGVLPVIVGETLQVVDCPVVLLADAAGLSEADRALLAQVPSHAALRPLVLNEYLAPGVAADVTGLVRVATGASVSSNRQQALRTALTVLHAERRLTLQLLQEAEPERGSEPGADQVVVGRAADVLAADRARIEAAVAALYREAMAVSAAGMTANAAAVASGFEAAALRGAPALDAIDVALEGVVRLAGDLTTTWIAAEVGVAELVGARVPALARQLVGAEAQAVVRSGPVARTGNGHAVRPAFVLLRVAASLEALRARLVAVAVTVRPDEDELAEAATADASRRLLAAADAVTTEVDAARRAIEAWVTTRLDDIRCDVDRSDAELMAMIDNAVRRSRAESVSGGRRDVALDVLAELDELEALLARFEAAGR